MCIEHANELLRLLQPQLTLLPLRLQVSTGRVLCHVSLALRGRVQSTGFFSRHRAQVYRERFSRRGQYQVQVNRT